MKHFNIFLFTLVSLFLSTVSFGASITGQVWQDQDNDDIQGNLEPGLEGVSVYLLDVSLNLLIEDTTDIDGTYLFSGLAVGEYYVQFDISSAPIGLRKAAAQHVGFFFDVNSDADSLGLTGKISIPSVVTDVIDIDFGLQVSPTGILSGMVWEDLNSNDIRDGGEVGVADIIVSLYDSLGNSVHVDTTDMTGQYAFMPAEHGKYVVDFSPASFPIDYNPVLKQAGADVTIDSDANPNGITDTIVLGGDISNIDLGLRNNPPVASLSGKVWYDGNNNGLFENMEVGISNVYIKLLDTFNNTILIDTTDVNGIYSFDDVVLNSYIVEFDTSSFLSTYEIVAKDAGTDDAIDSDAYANGQTDTILLQGNISNVDMGLYATPIYGAVNGKVWQDDNEDNLFTFGEAGIADIPVYLISSVGDTSMVETTDLTGKYSFSNVDPEDYYVAFEMDSIPSNFSIATKDFGGDDGIDSDVDMTGASDVFTLLAGSTASDIDMGLYPPSVTTVLVRDTMVLEVNENNSLIICLDSTELPGNVVGPQVTLIPLSGVLGDFAENCFSYTPDMDYVGLDSFEMILCDDLANCDTTYIVINIKEVLAILPIAVNDVDTVAQGVPAQLQVVANDTLYAPLVSLKILDYPSLGSAEADEFGFIKYTPEPNVCDDTVSMTYEICTEFGCDTASVLIYLDCNNISVFDGFSPNDDGVNDTFIIKGISEYPENKLIIFNRWGNVVLEQEKYDNSWTGYWDDNNTYLPDGTYFYIFETGEGGKITGSFEIVR